MIFLKLAGNKNRHKISDMINFGPDQNIPFKLRILDRQKFSETFNGKNIVSRIGSSSNLQVTRTAMKFRTSSNSGQIGPSTSELFALECQKL